MNNLFGWMKSTRSILAVMAMVLLFVVIIGYFLGGKLPVEVVALVSMVVNGIIIAYYGKRDAKGE